MIWLICVSVPPLVVQQKDLNCLSPKKGTKNQKYHCMRTPHPWIDTYIYIYTYSDSHLNYTFTRVFIRIQTYTHLQGCILYAYVHTHIYMCIYIYIYITGANVTPRHGWTCIGAAAACKCRQYELPDCGGRVLKGYTYIYIYVYIFVSCLKMAFLGFSNNSLEGIYQAHVQTCPFIYIYI